MVNIFKCNLFASKLPKWLTDSTICFLVLTQSNTFKCWPVTEFHTLSLPAGVYEMYSEHLQSQGNQVTLCFRNSKKHNNSLIAVQNVHSQPWRPALKCFIKQIDRFLCSLCKQVLWREKKGRDFLQINRKTKKNQTCCFNKSAQTLTFYSNTYLAKDVDSWVKKNPYYQ